MNETRQSRKEKKCNFSRSDSDTIFERDFFSDVEAQTKILKSFHRLTAWRTHPHIWPPAPPASSYDRHYKTSPWWTSPRSSSEPRDSGTHNMMMMTLQLFREVFSMEFSQNVQKKSDLLLSLVTCDLLLVRHETCDLWLNDLWDMRLVTCDLLLTSWDMRLVTYLDNRGCNTHAGVCGGFETFIVNKEITHWNRNLISEWF